MSRKTFEWPIKLLTLMIAAVVVLNLAFAGENSAAPARGAQRLREGTRLLEISGRFEAVGDQVNFVFADSGESVRILENLALERIFRVLSDSQASPNWIISGTVTEYNSGNYLLLTKAVQVGKSAPKESARAGGIGTGPRLDYSGSKEKKPSEKNQESSHDKHP